MFNFGIEGDSYTKDGNAIKFTDKILKNPKGLTYDQALATYSLSIMDGPINQDSKYLDALMTFQGQKDANAEWMKGNSSLTLPAIRTTEDESKTIAAVMGQVNTYINEMLTSFIMGKTPMTEYDKFVKTIQGMGIDQATKIYQDSYNRYLKR